MGNEAITIGKILAHQTLACTRDYIYWQMNAQVQVQVCVGTREIFRAHRKVIQPDDIVLVGAGVLSDDEFVVSAHHGQVVRG